LWCHLATFFRSLHTAIKKVSSSKMLKDASKSTNKGDNIASRTSTPQSCVQYTVSERRDKHRRCLVQQILHADLVSPYNLSVPFPGSLELYIYHKDLQRKIFQPKCEDKKLHGIHSNGQL